MRNLLLLLILLYTGIINAAVYFDGSGFVGPTGLSVAEQHRDSVNASDTNNDYYINTLQDASWGFQYQLCVVSNDYCGAFPSVYAWANDGECPPPLEDNGSGQCVEPSLCPASGTTVNFWADAIMGPTFVNPLMSVNDCEVSMSSMSGCSLYKSKSGAACEFSGTFTGNTGGADGTVDTSTVQDIQPIPSSTNQETTADTTVNDGDPTVSQDGTVTDTDTITTTETKDSGTIVNNGNNTVTIQNSDGTTTVYSENKTTTIHPDGTATEQINRDTTVSTPNTETTVINKSNGSSTTTNTTGTTNNYNTSTTNNYASDGTLADSSSTSSGDSTTGQDTGTGEGEGDCNPLIESCGGSGEYTASGDGQPLYEKTDKTFQSVITKFKDDMSGTVLISSANNFFNTNLGGTCPVWTIPSVMGMPAIAIDAQCSAMMTNIWPLIAAIILATAGFIAFRWAVL